MVAAQAQLSIFRCPASTDLVAYHTSSGGNIFNRYAISYAAVTSGSLSNPASLWGAAESIQNCDDGIYVNSGGFNNWGTFQGTRYRRDGAFYQNSTVRLLDVTTGTSNVVAVGERVRLITNPSFYPQNNNEYGTWAMASNWSENFMMGALGTTGAPFNYNCQTAGTCSNTAEAYTTAGCFSSMHSGGDITVIDPAALDKTVTIPVAGKLEYAAASRTFCTAGTSRAIKTAMIAMTTSNSMSVKPRRWGR